MQGANAVLHDNKNLVNPCYSYSQPFILNSLKPRDTLQAIEDWLVHWLHCRVLIMASFPCHPLTSLFMLEAKVTIQLLLTCHSFISYGGNCYVCLQHLGAYHESVFFCLPCYLSLLGLWAISYNAAPIVFHFTVGGAMVRHMLCRIISFKKLCY